MKAFDFSEIQGLIQKSISDREVSDLVNSLGDVRKSSYPGSYYLISDEFGIQLVFNNQDYFQSIHIHNKSPKIDPKLPYDIKFSDLREDIERKLGFPERGSEKPSNVNTWAGYPDKGLSVIYTSKSPDDLKSPIQHVSIFAIESTSSRIRFQNKYEFNIYFQALSTEYGADTLAELLNVDPDRIFEDTEGFLEVYITKVQLESISKQFRDAHNFIESMADVIEKLNHAVDFKILLSLQLFRSYSVNFTIPVEFTTKLNELDIEFKTEFYT